MSRTILYARVSTKGQTIEHQLTQAQEAGFQIDETVADIAVSGVSTILADRPEGRRLFDMLRSGDTLVVRWIDRLGRNYEDVTSTVRLLLEKGVTVRTVIHNLTFDGSPKDKMQKAVRDALIAFMAAMAEAQAEATKEAQKAGIEHARANITSYRGRKPTYNQDQFKEVRNMLAQGVTVYKIAKETGLSRPTVDSIRDEPDKCIEVLKKWGLWRE